MLNNFIEKIFWIQDQIQLKTWQEKRLYHAQLLERFHVDMCTVLDILVKAYMSNDKQVLISESLFVIENDVDMNSVLHEIREFLDYIKSDREGWGGAIQGIIDNGLSHVEIFANFYNKE
jgi:hypothetical protein